MLLLLVHGKKGARRGRVGVGSWCLGSGCLCSGLLGLVLWTCLLLYAVCLLNAVLRVSALLGPGAQQMRGPGRSSCPAEVPETDSRGGCSCTQDAAEQRGLRGWHMPSQCRGRLHLQALLGVVTHAVGERTA